MNKIKHLPFILLFFIFTGCSGYNSVLKSDDFGLKFSTANEYFENGDEMRALALYEQIYQRMPTTPEGELSYFRIGKAYYIGEDFYMAGYYFAQFGKRFPASPRAEDALFLTAMCSVSNSPEYTLDQTDTEIAINDLQVFIDQYPESSLVDSCNNVMDRLRYKIELKEYKTVKLYAKTENYRAAVSSSMTFLEKFSRSKFVEEVHFILIENSYLLQVNSVESKRKERIKNTIERYNIFVNLYPNSEFLKKAEEYNYASLKDLEEYN